jgi:hypothetical protein
LPACGTPQALQVVVVGRAGVDGDVAGVRVAHQITVGAGAGHHAGVGGGEALQVLQQRHGLVGLPVQVVVDLPIGRDQGQLAKRGFVLHVARFVARQPTGAGAAGPKRLVVDGAGLKDRIHTGKCFEAVECADGRKDDEELAGCMAVQRVLWANPNGLELFGLVGHRGLAFGHAGHQKGHVKAARQVAVGDPVGQHKDLFGGEAQASGLALVSKRAFAVDRRNVTRVSPAPIGMAGEQDAQLFEALADGGNRLRQVQLALGGAALRHAVRLGIGGVDAAAGKDISAGRETGRHGSAGHQDLNAIEAITQQQHSGGWAQGGGFTLGVEELGCACHAPLSGG